MHHAARFGLGGSLVATLVCMSGCAVENGADSTGTDVCSGSPVSMNVEPATRPIAFTSDRSGNYDLWLMEADGSDAVQLTASPEAEVMPSWSPDGARLAFASAVDLETTRADVCVINADGTGLRNLTGTADIYEIAPAWSPDGTQIAFGTLDDEATAIFVMEADGGGTRMLAADGNWPSWSPDGEHIVFSASRGGLREGLWTVNLDGSGESLLAEGDSGLTEPAWSPDGRSIAYVAASGNPDAADPVEWNEDIFVMTADGGPGRQITTRPGNDHWPPAWSPDGSQLAFTADGTEVAGEIVVTDLTTLAETNLTNDDAVDMFPAWRH
jgi:Tol biopolymer transport system component